MESGIRAPGNTIESVLGEPFSTKIMLERYELENKEGGRNTERYKELKATFGKFHGISSLTNLVAMCAGVAYGFVLSSVLKA